MAIYQISGTTNASGKLKIFQGEVYKGFKEINVGSYFVRFEASSPNDITAKLERPNGESLAYGNITAYSGTGLLLPVRDGSKSFRNNGLICIC